MISDELSKTSQFCSGSRNEQELRKFPLPLPARSGRSDPRHGAGYCDTAMTTKSAGNAKYICNSKSEISLTDVVCELCL